jgi:hypothetical protein
MSDQTLPHVGAPGAMIAPARTALVVVDIQVDFAAPEGVVGQCGVDMGVAERVVDRIEPLIAAARRAGVTVAFLRVMTRPESDSHALRTLMERRGTPAPRRSAGSAAGARPITGSLRSPATSRWASLPIRAFRARTSTSSCARAGSTRW